MKLANPQRGTSFYESFSDLIFGALVLFLVMVMALALQLRQTTAQSQAEVEKVIHPNRFAGGSSRTTLNICHVPVGSATRLVWVPETVRARWTGQRGDSNDPVLDLCKQAKSSDGFTLTSSEELAGIGDAIPHVILSQYVNNDEIGLAIHYLEFIRRTRPDFFRRSTPEQLRDYIGGMWMNNPNAALAPSGREYRAWRPGSHRLETITPAIERAKAERDLPPRIKFSASRPGRILLGKYELTAAGFRNMLRSIKPGSGFYVEYVSPSGEAVEPPEWVRSEILERLGYDRRVLSDQGRAWASRL